jgi:proteasome beta subunit
MKKRFHAGLTYEEAVRAAVEALLDASDEDVATGGFDFVRDIVPTMKIITEDGAQDVDDAEMQEIAEAFLEEWRRDYRARRA